METVLLKGKPLAHEIRKDLAIRIEKLSRTPVFCDILVGDDAASKQYVTMKNKFAESLGMRAEPAVFDSSITTDQLCQEVIRLAKIPHMSGLIVQLPLPESIDTQRVLDSIPSEIDVDILSTVTQENFYNNKSVLTYPAAHSCYELLQSTDTSLADKNIVVIGQGMLVGRPLTHMLRCDGCTVTPVTKSTMNKKELTCNADVIISAAGVPSLITEDDIKEGVTLIDAGTTESGGGIVGDIDTESVIGKAAYLAPVPGGVGPLTVALLFRNVVMVAEQKQR